MKDLFKRLTAASIAAMMLPAAGVSATAENEDGDELVTFIVQTAAGTPTAVLKAELASNGTMSAMSVNAAAKNSDKRMKEKNREILEAAAEKVGADISESEIYTQLDSAFSITARRSDRDKLLSVYGVLAIEEAKDMEVVPDNEESRSVSAVSAELNDTYRGQGTLIAVIDSGFNVMHDYFKTVPSEVKYTEEQISQKTAELGYGAYYSAKIPYMYDYYQKSSNTAAVGNYGEHGTHVAGIAAGKNGVTPSNELINGTAPEAQLAVMACGSNDTNINKTAYLKALNDAAALGADVVNMSFGSDYDDIRNSGYSAGRTAVENARKAGIVVCASSGNSGIGFYRTAPNVENLDYGTGGNWQKVTDVISVASADTANYYMELTDIELSDGTSMSGSDQEADDKTFFDTVGDDTGIVYCALGRAKDFEGKDVRGKIALMQRGSISFEEKTTGAKNAGAVAAIIYDNIEEVYPSAKGFTLPTLFMLKSDGEELLSKLNADSSLTVVVVGTSETLHPNSNGGRPSSFSSWGASETLELVPNIMGFGGNVYSADWTNNSGYLTLSGTSMSSPYVAGICASVKSYLNTNPFGELTGVNYADLIGDLIMTSAQPSRDKNNIPYSPRLQGAGMASINRAVSEPVVLFNGDGRTLVNLGDKLGDTFTVDFTARNYSTETVTFDNVLVEVMTDDYDDDGYEKTVSGTRGLTVRGYTADAVTVPALSDKKVSISVTLDAAELAENREIFTNGFYIDGFVSLSGDGIAAGIPFMGFNGDWGALPIWDSTIYDEGGSSLVYDGGPNGNVIRGTYLATALNGTSVDLGIDPNTGEYSENYMIISPVNNDKKYDTLALHFTMFRASHNVQAELVGNKIYTEKQTGYFSKYDEFTYTLPDLSRIEEDEYTVRLRGWFDDGKTKTEQVMTYPYKVVFDNTPPQISQTLSADGNTLGVSVSDEYFVREIRVDYTDISGNAQSITKSFDCTKTAEEHSFTLTDADPETISVTACDYAYNTAVSGIDAPAASYELIGDNFVSDTVTDNNASLWQVTVDSGDLTMESISVRVNGKSPRDDKKIEGNFTNTAVVFGVVVSAFADKVTDMKAMVNGNEVETTCSDTGAQQP